MTKELIGTVVFWCHFLNHKLHLDIPWIEQGVKW